MRQEAINYPELDEKALVNLGIRGDLQAYEQLILRHEKKVAAAAYHLCGEREEGEDLAQEAFLKGWRALPGYRGQASFATWMMTILTNLWRDRLRKQRLTKVSLAEENAGPGGAQARQFPDDKPGPEDLLVEKDVAAVLGRLLQQLKPEFREVLILRDVQGFSYEEAAAISGNNLGTIKSRINRGRLLLKEKILAYQEQNPGFFRLNGQKGIKAPDERTEGGENREG